MSSEQPNDGTAERRITELIREGNSWGWTDVDGAMAGGYRTLPGAAEGAAPHQLGHGQHRDLADAYLEHGTAGDALVRAVDARAAHDPSSWAWWYDAQRGTPTPSLTPRR